AFGSTQLIFGYLADALKKGGAEILKNNAGSFLLRLLTFGITIYLHIAIGIYLEELYTSHLRKKITKKFLSANFNQAQKEKFILSRFDRLSKKSEEKRLIPWCLAALLFLIILVPTLYYFSYRYKLKRDREFDRENKRFKELKDNLEYIKTTGAEDREIQQSQQQFTNNLRRNYAFVLTKSIYATIPSYILVRFIPFTFLVISGQASKAILYAKLDKMFDACKTIFEMFWAYGGYESYSSSRKRLNETLANLEKYQISVPAPNYLPANRNNIIFQQVHFTYPQTKKKILDNFSFNFQKGKKYLITGPNGIGKSTLFRLIVKLYTPQQGIIKLDDTGLEKIDNST
ncbi:24811_t:CDS:2, partial [Racocetra persica]